MKQAGIRELKQNASAVVAAVAAGATVVITDRGRPVAQLVPLHAGALGGLLESGRARPARHTVAELGEPPRRTAGERELSVVLDEMRANERW